MDVQSKYWFVTINMGPVNYANIQKKINCESEQDACVQIAKYLQSGYARRPPKRGTHSGLGIVSLKSGVEVAETGTFHLHAAFDNSSRKTRESIINFFYRIFCVQADVRVRTHNGDYCNKEESRVAGPFNYNADAMKDPSKRGNVVTMSHKIVADLVVNERLTRHGLWNHSLDAQVFFAKNRGYVENLFKLSTEFSLSNVHKRIEEEE